MNTKELEIRKIEDEAIKFRKEFAELSEKTGLDIGIRGEFTVVPKRGKPTQKEADDFMASFRELSKKYGMDYGMSNEFSVMKIPENLIVFRQSEGMESGVFRKRLNRFAELKTDQQDAYKFNQIADHNMSAQDEYIIGFDYSEELGPLTYCADSKERKQRPFPIRGFAGDGQVKESAKFKRFIPQFLERFKSAKWYEKIGVLLSLKVSASAYFNASYKALVSSMIDPKYYTPQIKETRGAMLHVMPKENAEVLAFFLEYDSAYRYRWQDFIGELNKDLLKKNPKKEVIRLLDILVEREYAKEKNVWKFARKIAPYVMTIPHLREKIVRFLTEIDTEKVRMNEGDIFWSNRFVDYNFRGIKNSERFKENEEKYGQVEYYWHEDQEKVAA